MTVASPHTSEIGIIFCAPGTPDKGFIHVLSFGKGQTANMLLQEQCTIIQQNCRGGGGRMTPVSVSQ